MNPEKSKSVEVRMDTVLKCRSSEDLPLCQYTVTLDYETGKLMVEIHTLSGATTAHKFITETKSRKEIELAIEKYLNGNSLP
jgi:hypothetical protein